MKKISFVLGTRPEAVKLAPLIRQCKSDPYLKVEVCSTGQHREMLRQTLEYFDLHPDVNLDLMTPNQTLAVLNAKALTQINNYLNDSKPDLVIVQGDTTTVLSAALAAFYEKIPVAHVEAGLRTENLYSPFPEEMNRVLTSRIASLHFAPTNISAENLQKEGLKKNIFITGNTVIDALFMIVEKLRDNKLTPKQMQIPPGYEKIILITSHRRENFGDGIVSICNAIRRLAKAHQDCLFLYPVHLNPNIQQPVLTNIGNIQNVVLLEPLDYLTFISLMDKSYLVLTDSGGVQEEAPSLGKPVLVMRENSERPEAILAGTAKLVGTSEDNIFDSVTRLLEDPREYSSMANAINPYGNGKSSEMIHKIIKNFLYENSSN